MEGADHREIEGIQLDVARAGDCRVKREVPPGFRWSCYKNAIVGTDLCRHAHVGFLAHGKIHIEHADGCTVEFASPQADAIEAGRDGKVAGDEPAVIIEFDWVCQRNTRIELMPVRAPAAVLKLCVPRA
jgi:hypothetical protein